MKLSIVVVVLSITVISFTMVAQERDSLSVPKAWQGLFKQESPSHASLAIMLEADLEAFFKEVETIRRLRSVEGSYSLYEEAISVISSKAVDAPLPVLRALGESRFEEEHIVRIARSASESLVDKSAQELFSFLGDIAGGEGRDIKVNDLVLQEMLVAAFRHKPKLAHSWIKKTSSRLSLLAVEDHDVLRAVIDVSPESVIDLARTNEEIQLNGLTKACVTLAQRDLEAATKAISLWKSRGDYPYREITVAIATMLAEESDLDKSKKWSEKLGVEGQRAWYHVSAIENPTIASRKLLDESSLSSIDRGLYSFEIVRQWAKESPQDAAAFLEELASQGVQSDFAYEAVAESWLGRDLEKASTWVASLESDDMRNVCTRTIVTHTMMSDPERAFQWALRLPDGHPGQQYVEMAFRAWHRSDSEAAVQSLEEAELPDKFKAPLLARP